MFPLGNAALGVFKGTYGLYMYYDTAGVQKSVKKLGSTLKHQTFGLISTILSTFDELMLKKLGVNNIPFKRKTLHFFDQKS